MRPLRADDEARTRDLNLGKVALYQLSYVRLSLPTGAPAVRASGTLTHAPGAAKSGGGRVVGARRERAHGSGTLPRVLLVRAWIDGRTIDPTDPAVRVDDHGLTVGDGVFESLKVVDGVPFALTRHLRRLAASAAGLGLPPVDEALLRAGIGAVLDPGPEGAAPLQRLRITVTGGPAPMGSGRGEAGPTVVVAAAPLAPAAASVAVVTVPWPRNERGATAGLKTTSYAENVVALDRARSAGAQEAVLANTVGDLCEGTGSNVFYVVDGELRTPSLASGCLAGVTRGLVLEWHGAREVDEPVAVAEAADEVFLVSTTRDVQPVHRWGDRELPVPGPVTAEVARTWARREAEHADP